MVMVIGQSIYNVPTHIYLLVTKISSIVEYQLKCFSVADDAAPDCRMAVSYTHLRAHETVLDLVVRQVVSPFGELWPRD